MDIQDKNILWNKCLSILRDNLNEEQFNAWFKPISVYSYEDNRLVLTVPSQFFVEKLEGSYLNLVKATLRHVYGDGIKLYYNDSTVTVKGATTSPIIDNRVERSLPKVNNPFDKVEYGDIDSQLNPKYTFDSFVVGNNNRFAHAAALAVAEAPATSYNPLFIYGGVGLGKTHLMHAIGNEILRNNKSANILYVTSEKFTNQLINAIKDNKNEQFRSKYRNIDVLLIDDIQFIAGKERVQEEFFHTFNTLHESGKQVIISSDRPPKDINLLEDRLKSRFEWGLIADISNADYETRLAILRKKAQLDNIIIDDEILANIANRIDTNIRELEGALNKLIARASLINSPITMEMAEWAINEIVSSKDKVISSSFIQETVAKYFSIDPKDIAGAKRSADVVFPRQIAMYLCRTVPQLSLPQIGKDFGNRDHTTVMHACNKIEKEIKENKNTKLIVESVKNILLADQ